MGAIQDRNASNADESLDALLADLNLLPEEVTVEAEPVSDAASFVLPIEVNALTPDVADVVEAVEEIELAEAIDAIGELAAEIPEGDGVTQESVAPAKKADKKSDKKAKSDKPKAEPKEKKEAVARKHYSNKVERLSDKLGDKLGDFTVLELADAMLEGDALKAKQEETLAIIKSSGKKVQNRQTFILEFIAGKSEKLNGVITTALAILAKDGEIVTGVEGNLYKGLIAHPYSPNAAKAMGGNTLLALKTLKVVTDAGSGKYVANPNSLILAKLKAMGVA